MGQKGEITDDAGGGLAGGWAHSARSGDTPGPSSLPGPGVNRCGAYRRGLAQYCDLQRARAVVHPAELSSGAGM
jgi:hypothetical protein